MISYLISSLSRIQNLYDILPFLFYLDQILRSEHVDRKGDKRVFEKKRLKIIHLLLSNGAHVNMDEDGHDSPLLLSIQYEDIEAMLVLLTAKPNLCHRGLDSLNAFEKSMKSGEYM